MKYLIDPIKQVFDIKSKATRKEFWTFVIFMYFVIYPIMGVLFAMFPNLGIFEIIAKLIVLMPLLSLGFRRLNDTAFSKWLFLIPLVNLILAAFPPEQDS
ncbi:MAG: DUF805 domain-containing protein [Leeuwenhoekiella sp.]